MAFALSDFIRLRPYLYHLTYAQNVERIRATGRLESAASLMRQAGRLEKLGEKRKDRLDLTIDGHTVSLRDQKPLHEGNMSLDPGMDFPQFVRMLNDRVYFWPGTEKGAIDYGKRHLERYRDEGPVLLRFPTQELFDLNAPNQPEFCRYNSGSPRWVNGKPSPRGTATFVSCDQSDVSAGGVVEVTFYGGATAKMAVTTFHGLT